MLWRTFGIEYQKFEKKNTGKQKTLESLHSQGSLLKLVPRTGFEPARPFGHHHLKVACLPISTPGLGGANIGLKFDILHLRFEISHLYLVLQIPSFEISILNFFLVSNP
jgi:hypothetical protein